MVSYSQRDGAAVRRLTSRLDKFGIKYFIDVKDITPGHKIGERVREGIHECSHVLVYVSAASKNSPWVSFELGMATALQKPIICYLSHPDERPIEPLGDIKYITKPKALAEYLQRLTSVDPDQRKMSAIETLASSRLYYYPGGFASAIRLFGAADDAIPWSRVRVTYSHEPLEAPPDLLRYRDHAIQKRRDDALANEQIFFNGPNARLMSWRASPRDDVGSARELTFLEMNVGPVGWYDFEGLNDAFREILPVTAVERTFESFVGLSSLIRDGDPSRSVLSNILDNAVTLVTNDGYIGYQERGKRVASVPGRLTAAVAENVNRYLDETDAIDQEQRLHSLSEISPTDDSALLADYRPVGVPHPFAAAERGVAWELSPLLSPSRKALRLTGLSFDLSALHPNALYILPLDMSRAEVARACETEPGKEWYEGRLLFIPAYADLPETRAVLDDQRWVPAGKASVLRAMELLRYTAHVYSCTTREAIMRLVEAV